MKFENSLPLYYQMADDIKRQIKNGEIKKGDKLKTEKYYQEFYGISRVTVRKALKSLVDEGFIINKPNKGYFSCYSTNSKNIDSFVSTHQRITKLGKKSTSDILKMEQLLADEELKNNLECSLGDKIIAIHRVRKVDDKPYAYQIIWLQEKMFKNFNPWLLKDHSLRSIMEEDYNYILSYSDENIEAVMPSDYVVKLLCVDKREPILFITARLFTNQKQVAEYSKTYYLTSEYSYVIRKD